MKKQKLFIIVLLVVYFLLVIADGVHHSSVARQDTKLMTTMHMNSEDQRLVGDSLRKQHWSIGEDALVVASLIAVIALVIKMKHEPHA